MVIFEQKPFSLTQESPEISFHASFKLHDSRTFQRAFGQLSEEVWVKVQLPWPTTPPMRRIRRPGLGGVSQLSRLRFALLLIRSSSFKRLSIVKTYSLTRVLYPTSA